MHHMNNQSINNRLIILKADNKHPYRGSKYNNWSTSFATIQGIRPCR